MNNLLRELHKLNVAWSVSPSKKKLSEHSTRESPTLRLELARGTQTLERHFHIDTPLSTEQMVATLLKEQWSDLPALRAWLDSKGNVAVALEPSALESLGECMHTALRKLADSKQSVITWNALHQMHSSDRVALWTAAEAFLRTEFAKERAPTRRSLAKGLQTAVVECLDKQSHEDPTNSRGRPAKREPQERFALLAMIAACELTDIEEWMWGWLGYVVKDLEPAEETTTSS